ncbi:MAG: protein kinase [Bacteroidota bacterium]
MKREPGSDAETSLASDVVLAVNPRVTFRWTSRSAEADNRSRNITGLPDESVGLSTLRVEERTLLALADGRRSLDDLAKLAGMSAAVATRHLSAMCDRGLLVPTKAAETAAPDFSHTWSGDMLAPRAVTDALISGPVEYDYIPADNFDAVAGLETKDVIVNGPSLVPALVPASASPPPVPSVPSVLVGADLTEPSPSKAVNDSPAAGAVVEAPASPADSRPSLPANQPTNPPTKKSSSGPNVTLFWIPSSPSDQPPGAAVSETNPDPAPPAGDSAPAVAPPRKSTGEGTVVVVGSPASSSSGASSAPASGSASMSGEPASTSPSTPPVTAVTGAMAGAPSAGIPFRVGSYEVATRIAQGAMGSIYVCRRVGAAGFQRLFTLKVVRQHSTQKEVAVRSFMREARIGALLDHPNVQTLVDVGTYEDQPFLILDYIEGTNLADLLSDERRPPAPVVVSVLLDVLRGLQHVHDVVDEQGLRSGLIHGDVSPQNILVGIDGAARLTDFGSARFAMESQATETEPVTVGKPAYMAPEQLRGELGDARTDLFSVGVVLWTALTGQKLFAAETYDQTAMRVMRRKIPPPSEHGSPACLDAIVLKALNRAPEGRYASAEEMARDLLAAAAPENLVASPRDVGQWVRRELGETLADRRRKIQDMFGGNARTPAPVSRPNPVRQYKTTPKTADRYERLPAKTVQISAVSRDLPEPPSVRQPSGGTRSQWYVVILSAVVAGCALAVAIAYLVSSLMAPPKRAPKKPLAGTSAVAPALEAPVTAPASGR